jgi:pyridoxal phosphate enzyme (YggS family)
MSKYQEIAQNYQAVLSELKQAASRSGRDSEAVRLVVVTKSQPLDRIKAVIDLGARHLGENRVEEALPKMAALAGNTDLHWHMIGHVQSRKAKNVLDGFQLIHSLDSLKLADLYERLSAERGIVLPVLLELNSGGETSKYGWDVSRAELIGQVVERVDEIIRQPHLAVRGVMTMAPLECPPDELRRIFKRVKRVQMDLKAKYPNKDIIELSMGTSADFTIAVEEGATVIRVGQAIMGQRS